MISDRIFHFNNLSVVAYLLWSASQVIYNLLGFAAPLHNSLPQANHRKSSTQLFINELDWKVYHHHNYHLSLYNSQVITFLIIQDMAFKIGKSQNHRSPYSNIHESACLSNNPHFVTALIPIFEIFHISISSFFPGKQNWYQEFNAFSYRITLLIQRGNM